MFTGGVCKTVHTPADLSLGAETTQPPQRPPLPPRPMAPTLAGEETGWAREPRLAPRQAAGE
uniref:Uncharacterized protein n=1 Tax=Micrococcus sp. V7 TaxID=404582 RepID=U5NWN0_9MICC|nr:hypothetical protein LMV7_p00820 [Micrococcus sp. V7]